MIKFIIFLFLFIFFHHNHIFYFSSIHPKHYSRGNLGSLCDASSAATMHPFASPIIPTIQFFQSFAAQARLGVGPTASASLFLKLTYLYINCESKCFYFDLFCFASCVLRLFLTANESFFF